MDFSQLPPIYEKTSDGESYHGGYLLQQNESDEEFKYLGGKPKTSNRYDTMVVPYGLFYQIRINEPDVLEKEEESKCIENDMFDRLFYSVGTLQKQKKYSDNNKTRKK